MTLAFLFQVVWALALVTILLLGMVYVARSLQRGRVVASAGKRLVTTVESTVLAQNVAVHVVKVAGKYYLVGGGPAGVALLAELESDDIEPYIAAQRSAVEAQRETLMRPFTRFKRS
jgi:flagellar biogenesis protein FliO